MQQSTNKWWCPNCYVGNFTNHCQVCGHTPTPKGEEKSDQIVHPNHYSRWAMEPIEFIAINNLPWWLANVVKYTMRYDAKNGLEDLYKARSYLEMKIRQLEGQKRFWDKPVSDERKLNGK